MQSFRNALAGALLITYASAGSAIEPNGAVSFAKGVPGTDKTVPITRATLADKVYFIIAVIADPGDHAWLITVYDGKGREAYRVQSTLSIKMGPTLAKSMYQFNKSRDAAGVWWYVAALDNKVIASNSLEVDP